MTKLNKFKNAAAGGSGFKKSSSESSKVSTHTNFKKEKEVRNFNNDGVKGGSKSSGLPNLAHLKQQMIEGLERKKKLETNYREHLETLKTQTYSDKLTVTDTRDYAYAAQ